jgi:hypothetical protein
MPTISMFFGFVVQMYWRDHNPPHVHVFYQSQEALVAIATGEIIAGSLPTAGVRLIREWILSRQTELQANWERGRQLQPFERIPGADNQ